MTHYSVFSHYWGTDPTDIDLTTRSLIDEFYMDTFFQDFDFDGFPLGTSYGESYASVDGEGAMPCIRDPYVDANNRILTYYGF